MPEMPESFTSLVLGYAITHTLKVFKSRIADAFYVLASAIIGAPMFIWLWGAPNGMKELAAIVGFAFAPLGVFTLCVFVWHLWLAPAALAYEQSSAALLRFATSAAIPEAAQEEEPVSWRAWKQRTKYTIYEFAAILANDDPADALTNRGSAYVSLLVESVREGKLSVAQMEWDSAGGPGGFTTIPRSAALAWAKERDFPTGHIE